MGQVAVREICSSKVSQRITWDPGRQEMPYFFKDLRSWKRRGNSACPYRLLSAMKQISLARTLPGPQVGFWGPKSKQSSLHKVILHQGQVLEGELRVQPGTVNTTLTPQGVEVHSSVGNSPVKSKGVQLERRKGKAWSLQIVFDCPRTGLVGLWLPQYLRFA